MKARLAAFLVALSIMGAPLEASAIIGNMPTAEALTISNTGSPNFTQGATGCTSTSVSFNTNSFVTCTSGAWVVEPVITPLIYPTSDSTTAIQFDKANGSTNVVDIDTTNGRVGIGTTSPTYTLHTYSSSSVVNASLASTNDQNVSSLFYTARSGLSLNNGRLFRTRATITLSCKRQVMWVLASTRRRTPLTLTAMLPLVIMSPRRVAV